MNDCGDAYKAYKLTAPNGKVYIGMTKQTLQRRFSAGRGYKGCPRMHNAIKKYGWENFKHEILFDGLSKEEAEQKEIELIRAYKSNLEDYGYNIENGGNVSGTHSEETKKKISAAHKGKHISEEVRKKCSQTKKGKLTGAENPFYGKRHTEECKKKHSDFMKGNKYNLGHHHTEEFKKWKSQQMKDFYSKNKPHNCKAVYHYAEDGTLIERFESLTSAAKSHGCCPATMSVLVRNEKCKEWCYEE